MKLHEFLLPGAALFCLLALLLLPEEGAQAARDALALCAQTVVPSLFPFFVCVALLKGLGVFGVKSGRVGAAIFKIFAVSLISGTPTGPMLIGSVLPESTELNYKKLKALRRARCRLRTEKYESKTKNCCDSNKKIPHITSI